MVKITREKTLKRETQATDRMRPITVTLHPFHLGIGVKGTREFHAIAWDLILDRCRMREAQERLAQRQRKRA